MKFKSLIILIIAATFMQGCAFHRLYVSHSDPRWDGKPRKGWSIDR